jgi:hypothetical protein
MEAVIVQFALNEKQNQDAAGDSDGETHNIDERISSMFLDDPQDNCDVVLDHAALLLRLTKSACNKYAILGSWETGRERFPADFLDVRSWDTRCALLNISVFLDNLMPYVIILGKWMQPDMDLNWNGGMCVFSPPLDICIE